MTNPDSWYRVAATKVLLLGYGAFAVGVLSGIAVLGYQCYVWIRAGVWVSLSALSILTWLELQWALSPRDWIGLHKLLAMTPLFLTLPLLGIALAAFGIAIGEERES